MARSFQTSTFAILGESRQIAAEAGREAARLVVPKQKGAGELYAFEVFPTPPARDLDPATGMPVGIYGGDY